MGIFRTSARYTSDGSFFRMSHGAILAYAVSLGRAHSYIRATYAKLKLGRGAIR